MIKGHRVGLFGRMFPNRDKETQRLSFLLGATICTITSPLPLHSNINSGHLPATGMFSQLAAYDRQEVDFGSMSREIS